jgi:hypothetical protein
MACVSWLARASQADEGKWSEETIDHSMNSRVCRRRDETTSNELSLSIGRTGNRSRPRRRTLIAHDTPDLPTSRHERHALATDYRGQYRENVQQQQHPMEP